MALAVRLGKTPEEIRAMPLQDYIGLVEFLCQGEREQAGVQDKRD